MYKPASSILILLSALLLRISLAVDLSPSPGSVPADQRCLDNQGHFIESGDRFIPSRSRPCTECLCARGNPVLCGIAICIGQVNCSLSRWNNTLCCKPECIYQKRLILSDFRNSNYNPTGLSGPEASAGTGSGQATGNRDLQRGSSSSNIPSSAGNSYFDTGAVFGIDDAAGYIPSSNYDVFNVDHDVNGPGPGGPTNSGNGTGVARAQNLPSPYYPILIGLISCAPVALCIICINALRKYFHARSHHSHPQRGFFSGGRRRRNRHHSPPNLPAAEAAPPVYMDPPPAYKDLHGSKDKPSEELPKYEDVLKYDQEGEERRASMFPVGVSTGIMPIFATTSSARFPSMEPQSYTNLAFAHTEGSRECISPADSGSSSLSVTLPMALSRPGVTYEVSPTPEPTALEAVLDSVETSSSVAPAASVVDVSTGDPPSRAPSLRSQTRRASLKDVGVPPDPVGNLPPSGAV